jgi:hypothetical protein
MMHGTSQYLPGSSARPLDVTRRRQPADYVTIDAWEAPWKGKRVPGHNSGTWRELLPPVPEGEGQATPGGPPLGFSYLLE